MSQAIKKPFTKGVTSYYFRYGKWNPNNVRIVAVSNSNSQGEFIRNNAREIGLDLNAGHDLDLQTLKYLKDTIPYIKEVSIGHALISDALYYGLENTIQMYLHKLS